jgi:hypothetical protein
VTVVFFCFYSACSNIRRYGFSADRFTLEGGHKAGRAAGLFIFKNCLGSSIRCAMEGKMREYQQLLRYQQQQQQHGTGAVRDDYAYSYVNVNDSLAALGKTASSTRQLDMASEPPPSPTSSGSSSSATGKTTIAASVPATKPKPKPAPKIKVANVQSNGSTSPETARNGYESVLFLTTISRRI